MLYIELNLVKQTATPEGKQGHVTLQQVDDAVFIEKTGDIGVKVGRGKITNFTHPMTEWDKTLEKYLAQGYRIVPGKTAPEKKKTVRQGGDNSFALEAKAAAQVFVDLFRGLAKHAISEAFTFSVSELTPEQISEGKRILKELLTNGDDMTLKEFNSLLCEYYSIIPRRMRRVADHVAHGKDKRGKALSEEKALEERHNLVNAEASNFDTVLQLLQDEEIVDNRKSFSETYGLNIEDVTPEEEKYIKKKLGAQAGRYIRAWKVTNEKTERSFEKFCKEHDLSDENHGIAHLFHGSPGQNWLSIVCGGWSCIPKNFFTGETPKICGKAYGLGIYSAKDAIKSMNYTGTNCSRWNTGDAAKGYLAIAKVAVGKPGTQYNGHCGCNSSFNWETLKKTEPGALCTWAESRYSGFCMDEIIVYRDEQMTIQYLIEYAA